MRVRFAMLVGTAGLITGLGAAAPALAQPVEAPAAIAPATPPLVIDKDVVQAGERVELTLNHGPEAVSYISSEAFERTVEHPAGAPEGLAEIVKDHDGIATATARIADVPPGQYEIKSRVGGGVGPSLTITVVQ